MTRGLRIAAGLVGALVTAYGVWLLLGLGWANTTATATWLVGGVVLHDAVFAPAVLVACYVALRSGRTTLLAPLLVALVVLVPVTLVGVPELGRFGARADNTTLLDRPYWLGWGALVTLVLVGVLVGHALRRRHASSGGGDDGAGAGGR